MMGSKFSVQRSTIGRRRRSRGFNLIELMVVITIIGLLAATVGVKLFGAVSKGKKTKCRSDIAEIGQALKLYRLTHGKYPADLRELLEPAEDFEKGFIDKVPKDPWGNEYIYERQEGEYLLKSLGLDGAEGGEGENADISNQDDDEE